MESLRSNNDGWTTTSDQIFWAEIAPCDHVVQIYESDQAFLTLLANFVHGGITSRNAVVVIATAEHLSELKDRLEAKGCNVSDLVSKDQFIALDAEDTLGRFMVNDWPDENLFNEVVRETITRAKRGGREVRAFGEMVAILWAKGQVGATVRLEQLWNKFCENEAFCLFCAYPKSGFTHDAVESLAHICSTHSKMIDAAHNGKNQLVFRDVLQMKVG